MSKFRVDQQAKVVYTRANESEHWKPGAIVTIFSVHIGREDEQGDITDYTVILANGQLAYPVEEQLEPIIEVGNWKTIEITTGWNPNKSKVED